MITIAIDPIIFSLGHFHLRWYGVIVVTAMVIGIWLAMKEASRKGFVQDEIYNHILWVIFAGVAGARIFHVIDHWPDEFAANPIRALYFWEGGLAIWGGIIGGLVATFILARQKGWKLSRLLDAFAPGVVLAQAIGRVACIITGDAMGKPTSGPFGIAYSNPNAMVPLGIYYTPTPVFEILMNLSIFILLWNLRKKTFPDGTLTLIYMALYSFVRFFIAFTSSYQVIGWGLNQAQWISIVVFLVCVPLLAAVYIRNRPLSGFINSKRI